jgi:hypothetical protein
MNKGERGTREKRRTGERRPEKWRKGNGKILFFLPLITVY